MEDESIPPDPPSTTLARYRSPDLEPWQRQHAEWLGSLFQPVEREDECKQATLFRGMPVHWSDIKALRRNPQWLRAFGEARAPAVDLHLAAARRTYASSLPLVARTYKNAVRATNAVIEQELENYEKGELTDQLLPAIRAAATILPSGIDRISPKKTESTTVATQISITLTPEQMAGLNAPQTYVTAEPVKVIPAPETE